MMDNAFESLVNELSATLADVVDAMKSGQDNFAEISTTLVDMLAILQDRKPNDLTELVTAIRELRINMPDITPNINVNVSPTPIQNIIQPAAVQIIERAEPGNYKLTVKYDVYDRITEALITRTKVAQK